MTIKTYARRDSAVSVMRKRGVPREEYGNYVAEQPDGTFGLDIDKLSDDYPTRFEKLVKKNKGQKQAPKSEQKPEPKKRQSVSARCCELILEGKDNKEVWEVIKKEFGLDDKKRGYPAWNRSKLRREGKL